MTTGIDNLGIPPMAGLCTYEEAWKEGYSVDRNVDLLKRYYFVKKALNRIMAAHIARTPEWEAKCGLGYHLWLEAEHCAMLRKRVSEMREPPIHMDSDPDPLLERLLDEAIRAEHTAELLTGIYKVIKPALIQAMQEHLETTNPVADQPTCRVLRILLMEEREMTAWGETAVRALVEEEGQRELAERWDRHLNAFLAAAGGIQGMNPAPDMPLPDSRATEQPYRMDPAPRRDSRFVDPYNRTGKIDEYYRDDSRSDMERVYALVYKRLREMDVPEWMGPIIYKTEGKPWDYYVDMSRQLWDEIRHSMLGEAGLAQRGIPFYKYPVELKSSMILNTEFEPIEAHLILWTIEQGLMPKATGKQWEWEIACRSGIPMSKVIQDYDWADEVLHAQIGRKWLVPEYGGMQQAMQAGQEMIKTWRKGQEKMLAWSEQQEWWPQFMAEIQAGTGESSSLRPQA